jgi:hypothetical protein
MLSGLSKLVRTSINVIILYSNCAFLRDQVSLEEEHNEPKVRLGLTMLLNGHTCCGAHLLLEFGVSSQILQAHVLDPASRSLVRSHWASVLTVRRYVSKYCFQPLFNPVAPEFFLT